MPAVSFINYSFCYSANELKTLKDINLDIIKGSLTLICGESGSGKTTLLRAIKKEIAPQGREYGEIILFSKARDNVSAADAGYVNQTPENQLVMDSVWHELAFGLENIGTEPHVIRRRIAEIASFFGIEQILDKKVYQLSGGQKQMINLASVLMMQPKLLLLDEPTAQLDPISAKEFLQMLHRVNRELGITLIISEHRLEDVLPIADSVILIEEGKILTHTQPDSFIKAVYENDNPISLALPSSVRLARRLGERYNYPCTIRAARDWLDQKSDRIAIVEKPEISISKQIILKTQDLYYSYSKADSFILKGLTSVFYKDEIHAIVGGNGCGKSTFMNLLSGAFKPTMGSIKKIGNPKIGLMPQNPKVLFSCDTLKADLLEFKKQFNYDESDVDEIMQQLTLSELAQRHPYDLSGGEMQKAALAKILLISPDILLLDEPAKGIDASAKSELAKILKAQSAKGKTIIFVTHDLEFAATLADRCSMISSGQVACTDSGRDFFNANIFYTTGVNRITRGYAKGCVSAEDLVAYE